MNLFTGNAMRLQLLDDGVAELCFDRQDRPVNILDTLATRELGLALDALETASGVSGLLVTSGKEVFIAGADITEFLSLFSTGEQQVRDYLGMVNRTFSRLEALKYPSVAAINGFALGGGFEICLCMDFRVAGTLAQVGLPETQLGIIPGWGGTVRLPRVVGVDVAIEWIAAGKQQPAETALKVGAVDAVVASEDLRSSALGVLRQAIAGRLDYQVRRKHKAAPLPLSKVEAGLAFGSAKAFVATQAGRNYPAPVAAVTAMEKGWGKSRSEALLIETEQFIAVAGTDTAASLIGIFLNDQVVSKKARSWEKQSPASVQRAAVLGAGIMGGGIAYQSALRGVPVKMKDVVQSGIDVGLREAAKLLVKQVERGQMTAARMAEVLNRIEPTLGYDGFKDVDMVVEAVVENAKIKHAVLAELERQVGTDTIIASNTSSISISALAEGLARPENFCGMHFFNPVHRMPLVEVIRGKQTSEKALARTVAFAISLGKKAIVVNDCPGFLVNRVLFPYFAGFSMLLRDGADFQQVDRVMEQWGWPMGPAYLLDVVGIDTASHAEKVMAAGFPDRMAKTFTSAIDVLSGSSRFGQKTGRGFYCYDLDKKGKPAKVAAGDVAELLSPHVAPQRNFSDDEIVARMMVPMANEMARCLEEGIVASVAEADMSVIYGIGFPPFRGGILRWVDRLGVKAFCETADRYAELGAVYVPPAGMRGMATGGKRYYASASAD